MQAKAAGRAGRALGARGVLYKARGPGTAGSSEVGCGMAGKACGSDNMLACEIAGKRTLSDLLPAGLCQRTCLRDVLVRHSMHVGYVAEVARLRILLLGLQC